jgi:hypothetical protein
MNGIGPGGVYRKANVDEEEFFGTVVTASSNLIPAFL